MTLKALTAKVAELAIGQSLVNGTVTINRTASNCWTVNGETTAEQLAYSPVMAAGQAIWLGEPTNPERRPEPVSYRWSSDEVDEYNYAEVRKNIPYKKGDIIYVERLTKKGRVAKIARIEYAGISCFAHSGRWIARYNVSMMLRNGRFLDDVRKEVEARTPTVDLPFRSRRRMRYIKVYPGDIYRGYKLLKLVPGEDGCPSVPEPGYIKVPAKTNV